MSALARLCVLQGHEVFGYDRVHSTVTNELEKEINRFAYRGSRESFNHEIRLYRNAANEAEKQIAANEVIQSLGYLPEDTETFFSIKDTFWMSQTKISNG